MKNVKIILDCDYRVKKLTNVISEPIKKHDLKLNDFFTERLFLLNVLQRLK